MKVKEKPAITWFYGTILTGDKNPSDSTTITNEVEIGYGLLTVCGQSVSHLRF